MSRESAAGSGPPSGGRARQGDDPRVEVELPWRRFDPRRHRPGVDPPAWSLRILDERALTEEESERALRETPPLRVNARPDLRIDGPRLADIFKRAIPEKYRHMEVTFARELVEIMDDVASLGGGASEAQLVDMGWPRHRVRKAVAKELLHERGGRLANNEIVWEHLRKERSKGEGMEERQTSTEPQRPLEELLDEPPAEMRRPLSLVGGRAYAAIWPHVRVPSPQHQNSTNGGSGQAKHKVTVEQRLMVVRDDGRVFGAGGDHPLDDLGIDVRLPEPPQAERQWSTGGVKSYRQGHRPDPGEVFNKVADVIDRFIDFDHSLADQRTMAEMISCYAVSTWFLDAFNVVGYLWPNGERGSGKTQLLTVMAELSYLGQVVLAGGSYSSLRDLADYGAFLAFDDAENFSDPRRTDPDKRALLLAGNRRGNTVPFKEAVSERGWRTRHVSNLLPQGLQRHQPAGRDPGEPHDRRPAHPHPGPLPGQRRPAGIRPVAP